jgi:hypothetical protein
MPLTHPRAGETGAVSLSQFACDDWIVPSTEFAA